MNAKVWRAPFPLLITCVAGGDWAQRGIVLVRLGPAVDTLMFMCSYGYLGKDAETWNESKA